MVIGPVIPGGLDAVEHRANRIDHRQQRGDAGLSGREGAVAHLAEEGLAHVGERFELGVPEEPAGAFDGVDSAENGRKERLLRRIRLKSDKVAVQSVEVLVALDQKVVDDFLHIVDVVHARSAEGYRSVSRLPEGNLRGSREEWRPPLRMRGRTSPSTW